MKEHKRYWEIMDRLEEAYNKDVTSEIVLLDAVKELLDYYNSQGYYKDEKEK
tara:strand:+ start:3045 stop:3200 length:156 start_codon:yes stop_codon:yes gene_type:complete